MVQSSARSTVFKKPAVWRISAIALFLLTVFLVGCDFGPLADEEGSDSQDLTTVAVEPAAEDQASGPPKSIAIMARLKFPRRAELTFDRAGEVEEILVSQGDRVEEGALLARLNSDHFPALEEEIVRLRTQIVEARDNIRMLNKDYSAEPLLTAQRDETVARLNFANTQAEDFFEDIDQNHSDLLTAAMSERDQAKTALVSAEDGVEKAQRDLEADHSQVIAAAEQAEADAELALDRAIERLADYKDDLSDDAVRASDRVTGAEVTLDQSIERLSDYKEDLQQEVIRAKDRVTKSELALDLAQDSLDDFINEHDRLIIRARTAVGAADAALDAARAPLTQFLRSPIRDLEADGKPVDVAKLESLQAAVDLAASNLVKAREDLAELEEGPDPFRVEELRSNVSVAELNLSQARDDLAELEEGPDPFLLEELESSVKVAELNVATSRENLAELEEGPDLLVLNQLQTQVDFARVNLAQARKKLNEAKEGPDELVLPRLDLNVILAERRLDLAERRLRDLIDDGPDFKTVPLMEQEIATRLVQIEELFEGPDTVQLARIESLNAAIVLALDRIGDIEDEMDEVILRAPFSGIIYLVNVEEDDLVSRDSRVFDLIDPDEIILEGFVDATEVENVRQGAIAEVSFDSVPGQSFRGEVAVVDTDPRTERGVIRYPVTIDVDIPDGYEIPFRLSAVDVVVFPLN